MIKPNPVLITYEPDLSKFLLDILTLGSILEISLVGVFNDSARGSRRDIDLPLHRDGEYSKELADVQGGMYVEENNIDYVALYCIKDSNSDMPCLTIIDDMEINLHTGNAVVFDNKAVLHGRKGPVGDRLLLRIWIKKNYD
jgi:hypothetical protein